MVPDLHKLLPLISETKGFRRTADALGRGLIAGAVLTDAARPYYAAALARYLNRPLLMVTARPERARELYEQMENWLPNVPVTLFPEPDILPYERLVSDDLTETDRLSALAQLANGKNSVVVASVPALVSRTVTRDDLTAARRDVRLGMDIAPFTLLAELEKAGYRAEHIVELPGTVSHRGGIVDIWPVTLDYPVRLEFFGDTVDSLRYFDPATQRSGQVIESAAIFPATELLALRRMAAEEVDRKMAEFSLSGCTKDNRDQFTHDFELMRQGSIPREVQFYAALFCEGSLMSHLPENTLLVLDDVDGIDTAVANLDEEAERLRDEKQEQGELPEGFPRPYFTAEEIAAQMAGRTAFRMEPWGDEDDHGFTPAPAYPNALPAFLKKITELLETRQRIVIVSHQADRLAELLDEEDIIAIPAESLERTPEPGTLSLVRGSLPKGWVLDRETYLFTDAEIFGFVKQRRQVKQRPAARHALVVDLVPDDYVVHIEHGIGRFKGVQNMTSGGAEKEFLILEYATGDTLYVPTDQIDRVNRYIGAGDRSPVLSRLGTQEWTRTRQKAKEAAEELAQELIALYAAREVVPGHSFQQDTVWQQELEAAFPYVETPDQAKAIEAVKEDMERPRPMDRLICGDVGYGKTEVAVRAAFKAVMDGKQVAILVPTTVLAQQHYATFAERLEAFPARVEVLSRFRTAGEQKKIIEDMAEGSVDICIGTHRLLQKDVAFKNLGLLIIDEEQRFGVNHKEHFKQLRQEVDVLAMSATPIPRTLHLSLTGVRDMSSMETAPNERLPVKTYVAEYNDHLVREAVLREIERNGQVFFVHNRVQSIGMVAANLQKLVPEARVAVGHGQMHEDDLEQVMTAFGKGEVDILVCTTIIESGLDIPSANTLIVNRADRFGLTQLYQLRGRVGRGTNLAYAYFLYDRNRKLTDVARHRLQTIYEATELGAGFTIAMKDLEIRGAGNLLGHRQSGHITAVGFSLYTRLLAEAVEGQKAVAAGKPKPQPKLPAPAVDLPLDAHLPEFYVEDVETRLELYRKLAEADAPERLDDILQEMTERFGEPPKQVRNLLYAVRLRGMGAKAGIESISLEEGYIIIRRFTGLPFDARRFMGILRDGITVGKTQVRLDYKRLGKDWRAALEGVIQGLLAQ